MTREAAIQIFAFSIYTADKARSILLNTIVLLEPINHTAIIAI